MENQQNTLYWAIIYTLISRKHYDLVSVSQSRKEAWLVSKEKTIRLKREDINFGIWLENDLFRTYGIYEQLKSKRGSKSKKLLNTYITSQLPVDDYHKTIKGTITPAVKHLGEIETILADEQYFQANERELLGKYGIEGEEDIALIHQLMGAGEADIVRRLSMYLSKKSEEKREIVDHGKVFVTYVLLGIQILMFILMELNGGSENVATLIRFGAKYNPLILDGEWWRMITPIFLHIGVLHLLMNSVALYYIGAQIEKIFGSTKFLCIYLFAGAMGVFASFLLNDSVAAGASGAIFGCFGALLYVGIVHRDILSKEVVTNILSLIAINLVFGFVVPNIDNAGHIGGLIGGFIMAAILRTPAQSKGKNKVHTKQQ